MNDRMVLVALLWLKDSNLQGFEAYERRAAGLMARHGGCIERAIRLDPSASSEGPFEVHVVSFPDRAAFEAYQQDPEVQALAPSRSEAIARTVLHIGRDGATYEA